MEFSIRKSTCLDSADSEATWLGCCCTMIYLAFAPGFWKEVRKILVISQVLVALTSPEFMVKSWFWIAASSQVSLSWDWVQRGQGVRGYIANYTCIMKAQWKAWMLEFLEVIGWQMHPCKEDWAYWLANTSMQRGLTDREKAPFWMLLDSALCLFLWLILICIL